ncbi:MAG: hypothetical protein WAN93_07575 [Solirubrobacteraceae bacterium]
MSSHASTISAATPKQLSYIKSLALQTGTTFTHPQTARQASREIQRLKGLKSSRGVYLEVHRELLDPIEQPYATEQKPGETIGYGSSARRGDTPAPRSSAPAPRGAEGEPVELGRYETRTGERRALYGIRVEGKPRIIDAAAEGRGRIYTVEQDLCEKGGGSEVKGIVANYIADAEQLGRIPMAKTPRSEREPVAAGA